MFVRICSLFFSCLAFFMFSTGVNAEEVRLSDDNVFLYYESRAEVQAPEHKLAEFFSIDYRRARDEFTKHDLMEKIRPALNEKMSEAASNDKVYVRVGTRLGEYDFDKHAFPTGFSESTFIPFQNGYALMFTNGNASAFVPVEMDKARSLSSELGRSRKATVILFVKLLSTEERAVDWHHNKVINGQITQMKVQLDSGTEVGSVSIQ